MKKIILWVSVLIVIVSWVFIWINGFVSVDNVSANPDYICTKNVTNSPCRVTNYPSWCTTWSASWERTCAWKKTTQVSYYLIRSTCETWYTQIAKWGNVWWTGWRQGSDYVSWTQNCSITEVDHVVPTWKIN